MIESIEMTELFLMRGTPEVFCFAPFAVGGVVHGEKEAFDYDGTVFCRIADTEELDCPRDIRDIGDVVEVLLSLCWSKKAANALNGINWAPTIRVREIEVRNSGDQILDVFQWACDFGRYDVLNRGQSELTFVNGTDVILSAEQAVVDSRLLPSFDIWGSDYGRGFFVTPKVRRRLEQACCVGFSFRAIYVV